MAKWNKWYGISAVAMVVIAIIAMTTTVSNAQDVTQPQVTEIILDFEGPADGVWQSVYPREHLNPTGDKSLNHSYAVTTDRKGERVVLEAVANTEYSFSAFYIRRQCEDGSTARSTISLGNTAGHRFTCSGLAVAETEFLLLMSATKLETMPLYVSDMFAEFFTEAPVVE